MDINQVIIENVKKHECLYNLTSKDYENAQKTTEIWKEIGGLVNLPGEACRKRWKGLQDTYKRRKRIAELCSGSGASSPPKKWKYMESLLNNFEDARARIESVVDKENDLTYHSDCSSSTVLSECTTTDESTTQHNEARPKKYTKKHADAEITSDFRETMKECANSVKAIASGNERGRDSTTLLFESLANKILKSNLPQLVVSRIEAKVFNLVFEEIAQNLTP